MATTDPTPKLLRTWFDEAVELITRIIHTREGWEKICELAFGCRGLSKADVLSIVPAIVAHDMGDLVAPRALWSSSIIASIILTMFSGWRPQIMPMIPIWTIPIVHPVEFGELLADAPHVKDVQDVMAPYAGRAQDKTVLEQYTRIHKLIKDWIRDYCPGIIICDANGGPIPLDLVKFKDPQQTIANLACNVEESAREDKRVTTVNNKKRVTYFAQLHLHAARVSKRPQTPLSADRMMGCLRSPESFAPGIAEQVCQQFKRLQDAPSLWESFR